MIGHNSRKWDFAVELLVQRMGDCPVGDVVTYAFMSKLLDVEITSKQHVLRRALKELEKRAIHFECVATEGYRRMAPSDVAIKGTKRSLLRTFRSASRGLVRANLGNDYDKLNRSERAEYHARSSVLQSLKTAAHANSVNAKVRMRSALDDEMDSVRGTS